MKLTTKQYCTVKEYADKLARDAFNLFNGIINENLFAFYNETKENAKDIYVLGDCISPSVQIYTDSIIRTILEGVNTLEELYDCINEKVIMTAVHELFHIEQIVNIIKYNNDDEYNDMVERAVRSHTNLFLYRNVDLIKEKLGIELNKDKLYFDISYKENDRALLEYKRKNYMQQIINIIDTISMRSLSLSYYDKEIYEMFSENENIILNHSIGTFEIKKNNEFCFKNEDIEKLMRFYLSKENRRTRTSYAINSSTKTFIININVIDIRNCNDKNRLIYKGIRFN